MGFGWHRAEREVFFAMAGTQKTNGRLALRPAFGGVRATRSLLKIEAWMPSEIKAISPLVNRLIATNRGIAVRCG